ncbi:YbaK/EbsC family protein [Hyphomicrobium sp. CS1GBMeth3]|uniref:aminoacyl-tRNA deacylase n=1 Tax=Hyphomicrobium sp. CS1GBMeth3 TaxID=1892845 RepID=UPI000930C4E1|nr:YbaK/EbsC family protein [Hyphomicrobium sp. CS1GBMeth3]
MGISLSLQQFLDNRGVNYDVMSHAPTKHSLATAQVCHIPEDNLAKGILLRRRDGYLLAIVPASRKVGLSELGEWLDQPIGLATEEEVTSVFADCEPGSVPPVASAYGLQAVMDDSLEGFEHIYFEGGDHCTLVHVTGREFHRLMSSVPHARFSAPLH